MTHPSAVFTTERELLPSHRLRLSRFGLYRFGGAEDAIDDIEGPLQVRVLLVVLGSHGLMPLRDGLKHDFVGFVTDALALDDEVDEGLGTEICLFLESRDNHGMS